MSTFAEKAEAMAEELNHIAKDSTVREKRLILVSLQLLGLLVDLHLQMNAKAINSLKMEKDSVFEEIRKKLPNN